ncbi:MAG TPA: hypothetical protein VF077_03980 [Nitrospiraceae bacterium]
MTNLGLVMVITVLLAVICLLIGRIWEMHVDKKLRWQEWVEKRERKRRLEWVTGFEETPEAVSHRATLDAMVDELRKLMESAKERRYGCVHWSEINDVIHEFNEQEQE